jgi:hypothetical protein
VHNLVIGMFLTECYSSGSCFLQLLLLGGGRALGWGGGTGNSGYWNRRVLKRVGAERVGGGRVSAEKGGH